MTDKNTDDKSQTPNPSDDDQTDGDEDDFDSAFDEYAEDGNNDDEQGTPGDENPAPADDDSEGSPPADDDKDNDGNSDDPQKSDGEDNDDPAKSGGDEEPNSYKPPSQQEWEAAQQEIRSNRGRVSALTRQVQTLQQPAQPPQGNKGADAPKKPEGWEELSKDYPEIAGPVEQMLSDMQQRLEQANNQIASLEGRNTADDLNANEQALIGEHADWEDVAKSNDFAAWIGKQPAAVQQIIVDNAEAITNPQDASWVISQFKKDSNWGASGEGDEQNGQNDQDEQPTPPKDNVASRRAKQLESSRSVPQKKGRAPASGPEDDFDKAFDYYANKKQTG